MGGAFSASFEDGRPTTLEAAVKAHAGSAPDSLALVDDKGLSVTYSELEKLVRDLDAAFAASGIGRNDRVGLIVPPGLPGAQLVVAIACNATLVPINPALKKPEISELAATYQLQVLVIPSWIPQETAASLTGEALKGFYVGLDATGHVTIPASASSITDKVERSTASSDIALLLRTSGTTGQPKMIPVSNLNLVAMADKISRWFEIGREDRAACTLPLYYAGGLKTTLFGPIIIGASVGFPSPDRVFEAASWIETLSPTYMTVVPASLNGFVERLERSGATLEHSNLSFILCGGSYLPEPLRLRAEAAFHAPVLEFFALSEAGVMAANRRQLGKRKVGTVGLPACGQMMLVDEAQQQTPVGCVGEIAVRGPSVTPGYIIENRIVPPEGGWLLTGDIGRLDEDGFLTILGRSKEIINRGGEKVFPYEVERTLSNHPAVLETAAFSVPHPRLGENVAVAVVLRPGHRASKAELQKYAHASLAPFKVPHAFLFLDKIPRSSSGKVMRAQLSDAYVRMPRAGGAPDRILEHQIAAVWKELLGNDHFDIDDDFFDAGGDSLLGMEMLAEVEKIVGQTYPQSELATLTIRHMADVLTAAHPAEGGALTNLRLGAGASLLFCHGDYLSRGLYANRLSDLLPAELSVYLLHNFPDMPFGKTVEEIAAVYADEVMRAKPASPIVICGYCNAGLIAWHLTHLLRKNGIDVAKLILVEAPSINARPSIRRIHGWIQRAASRLPQGAALTREAMRAVWYRARGTVTLPEMFIGFFTKRLPLPMAFQRGAEPPMLTSNYGGVHRDYFRMMSSYVPPVIDIDVHCILATQGNVLDTQPSYWRPLARTLSTSIVEGTHYSILTSGRASLSDAIAGALGALVKASPPAVSSNTSNAEKV